MPDARPAGINNLIVLAPAGSGKTEKLSRRYIELLQTGVRPERILTITFTEKAAAEMKERILKRLRENDPELYRHVRDNILKLRITTIHAFCLSLLRRFAPSLGLDPRIEVLADPAEVWNRARYDTLMRIAEHERDSAEYNTLMDLVSGRRAQGWPALAAEYDGYFLRAGAIIRARLVEVDEKRINALAAALRNDPHGPERIPGYTALFPDKWDDAARDRVTALLEQPDVRETYLTKSLSPRKGRGKDKEPFAAWTETMSRYRALLVTEFEYRAFQRRFGLFQDRFLAAYTKAKREAGLVDFQDIEYEALKLLSENDDWQNVLRAFDEQTDHLLVDEFQDTSFLQWGIIDKLTEEWRSGEGAKTEQGINPTIFLVGDDKQSIYMFRGAKVEVFATARDELKKWLGPARLEEEFPQDNYRSLQAIIDFNNALFSRLMDAKKNDPPWQTRYIEFIRARKNNRPGLVEILLQPTDAKMDERRADEAHAIANRVQSLVGTHEVFDPNPDRSEIGRPCEHKDIAILLRKRTHLHIYEQALREANVPFIVVGGIGFWDEPEIGHLLALLRFLVDPADDLALYAALRGPLLRVPEPELFFANQETGSCFLDRLRARAEVNPELRVAIDHLDDWLAQVRHRPLAHVLERVLSDTEGWRSFWEPQRRANIRKLLQIIEDSGLHGDHPLRLLDSIGRSDLGRESNAGIPTEDRNAVRLMTIHGAKGLQFPVMFLPGLDLKRKGKAGDPQTIIEERNPNEVLVSHITDKAARDLSPFHQEHRLKELEEHKRLLYVACTRARDVLILTGAWTPRRKGTWLEWLEEHLGLTRTDDGFKLGPDLPGVRVTEAPAPSPSPLAEKNRGDGEQTLNPKSQISNLKSLVHPAPLNPGPASRIEPVVRNIRTDYQHYADDLIGLGDVVHAVLEQISKERLTPDPESLAPETQRLIRIHGLPLDRLDDYVETVLKQIAGLKNDPELWDIIRPREDGRAELPFMLKQGDRIYSGRIDRVILTDTEVRIYDYKTYAIKEEEIPARAAEYHNQQLKHYARACEALYPDRKVSTYLIFTALPKLTKTG